jgi:hypothetical protein
LRAEENVGAEYYRNITLVCQVLNGGNDELYKQLSAQDDKMRARKLLLEPFFEAWKVDLARLAKPLALAEHELMGAKLSSDQSSSLGLLHQQLSKTQYEILLQKIFSFLKPAVSFLDVFSAYSKASADALDADYEAASCGESGSSNDSAAPSGERLFVLMHHDMSDMHAKNDYFTFSGMPPIEVSSPKISAVAVFAQEEAAKQRLQECTKNAAPNHDFLITPLSNDTKSADQVFVILSEISDVGWSSDGLGARALTSSPQNADQLVRKVFAEERSHGRIFFQPYYKLIAKGNGQVLNGEATLEPEFVASFVDNDARNEDHIVEEGRRRAIAGLPAQAIISPAIRTAQSTAQGLPEPCASGCPFRKRSGHVARSEEPSLRAERLLCHLGRQTRQP